MSDDLHGVISDCNRALRAVSQEELDPRECRILLGSLDKKSYREIAKELILSEEYLRKHLSGELWRRLSIAFGTKVTKNTIADALKIYQDQQNRVVSPDIDPDIDLDIQPVDDRSLNPDFLGREEDLKALDRLIGQGRRSIVIQAGGGVGKTTLARQYLATRSFEKVIELPMAKETGTISPAENVVEEWLVKDFEEDPGRDFCTSLTRLRRQLERQRVGILIDNLEPALIDGKFVADHRRYVDLLSVLTDKNTPCVLLITSRECLSESAIAVHLYKLEGLELSAWRASFEQRSIAIDEAALAAMHHACGGNAKAMDCLGGEIAESFAGDLAAFWTLYGEDLLANPELKDLVAGQFNRLQKTNPRAYSLLCRMGCYRYQDVPTIPIEGLFVLLWDVPKLEKLSLVSNLRKRGIIEFSVDQFYLHPIIRDEAISRLKKSTEEYKKVNLSIADYFDKSTLKISKIQDAQTAFQSYYHYISIDDFNRAANIVLVEREYMVENQETLGIIFYQMGLGNQIIKPLETLVDQKLDKLILSNLYNILGDLYWITGQIRKAIKIYENSINQALSINENHFNSLNKNLLSNNRSSISRRLIVGKQNISLCYLELWKLEDSLHFANESFELSRSFGSFGYTYSLLAHDALVKSNMNLKEEAKKSIDQAHDCWKKFSSEFSTWETIYHHLFLGIANINLDELDVGVNSLNYAIEYSEKIDFLQPKAKAYTYMAEVNRLRGNFEQANVFHFDAIKTLESIGAKPDLAEAYFHQALTYRDMGNQTSAEASLKKAHELYKSFDAPRQIERTQKRFDDLDS